MKNFVLMMISVFILSIGISLFISYSSEKPVFKQSSIIISHTTTPKVTPEPKISLTFTGDVMLGRSVMKQIFDVEDYAYPFRKTYQLLNEADLTFVNLENPVIQECKIHLGGFTFCADPKEIEGLKFAGIDIVTLANNHTLNYGKEGLAETVDLLNDSGIEAVGLDNAVIREVKGTKIGYVAFDFFSNQPKNGDYKLITDSKEQCDFLIVGVHWGDEYTAVANPRQQEIAHKIIKSGADLIIGHHPHWVQNREVIEGKPVYYSLGNFVFDQMWSEETKKGQVVRITLQNGVITNEETFKTYISSIGQPEIVR